MEIFDTGSQNLITIFDDEVDYFEKFVKKYNIVWKTEDKLKQILPISKSYVGYIVTPRRRINLLPKYKEIGFEHIFRMYLYVYSYKSTDSFGVLDVGGSSDDVDIASLFFESLQRNIQTGLIQLYQKNSINLQSIRGKVDFVKTYKRKLLNKKKQVVSIVSHLSMDNLYNQLIATALYKLKHVRSYSNIASKLLMYFDGVDYNIQKGSEVLELINFNSNTARYRQTLVYASMIIDELDYEDMGNTLGTESFLINFDRLFEDFVAKILKDIPSERAFSTWRDSKSYADVISQGSKIDRREYLPDIVYKFNHEDPQYDFRPTAYAVLDVKNKAYSTFKNADVYQLITYAKLLSSRKMLFLYPSFYRRRPDELHLDPEIFNPSVITACFINISDRSGEDFIKSIEFFVKTVELVINDIKE